jgi:hypothetical protein
MTAIRLSPALAWSVANNELDREDAMADFVVTGVQGTAEEMDEAGDTLLVTNLAQS